jgi:oligoribonuclease
VLGIFLDTETNGLNPFTHKPIEIAFKILNIESGECIDSFESLLFQTYEEWQGSDPESLQVNGFDWEQISYGKPLPVVSQEIQNCFTKCAIQRHKAVFICQNPSFDRAFFAQIVPVEIQEREKWPYHWLDLASMHWAVGLDRKKKQPSLPYPWEQGLSKDKIAQAYKLPPEKSPHRAMNGVDHLIACYKAVVGFGSYTSS